MSAAPRVLHTGLGPEALAELESEGLPGLGPASALALPAAAAHRGASHDPATAAHRDASQDRATSAAHPSASHDPDTLPEGDGWILVGPDTPASTLGTLVQATARHPGKWSLLLVSPEGKLTPVSAGLEAPPAYVAERLASTPGVLSLRHAVDELARIRHDLNNPLTAALGHVQLLLEDPAMQEGDIRESLEVVESELRRLIQILRRLNDVRLD